VIIVAAREVASTDAIDFEMAKLVRLTGFREKMIADARAVNGSAWHDIQDKIKRRRRLWSVEEKHTRRKAIQDPVHGAIIFEPWELDILSSVEMLRLRFIKQLGPAHLVYPGATHTRFLHCIGTNFLAQKCIRVVSYCEDLDDPCFYPLSNLLNSYQQKVFRAAALLHDVGHPPTSHTIEFALKSWAGIDHLDLGEHLILHSSLSDILTEHDIEPQIVIDVFRRRAKEPVWMLLSDFLDHPLDIDKTDYLIRDAHFSGVQLGIFPAERVMLTNRVVKYHDGRYVRAFMLKALHSLESLILSRNWMFSDLYLHHAVKLAEALTSKATYFRIREEDLSKTECYGLFTRMTDADLYRWFKDSSIRFVRDYARRIRHRRLFKVVLARSLSSFEPHAREELLATETNVEKLITIETEVADDVGKVIVDIVNPNLGETILGKIPLLVAGENSGLETLPLDSIDEGQPLMQILNKQKQTIPSVRVYSDPEDAPVIRKRFFRRFPATASAKDLRNEYDMTEA
jgi:HD superfamily phosphohydrolase